EYLGLKPKNSSTIVLDDIQDAEFKQDPVWFELEEANNNLTLKMNAYFGRQGGPGGLNNQRIVNKRGVEVGAAGFGKRTVYDVMIEQPSETVVFGDGVADDIDQDNAQRDLFWMREFHVGVRHDGGAQIGFADGSASLVIQETDQRAATLAGNPAYEVWYEEGSINTTTFAANPQELVWKVRGRDYN
ncbi:MAG: hypothetical protein AAGL98_15265, partial [Planctomycetota bacterium]